MFAYKLGYVLDKAHELIDFTDYHDLFNKYDTLKKISFDYAVVENESQDPGHALCGPVERHGHLEHTDRGHGRSRASARHPERHLRERPCAERAGCARSLHGTENVVVSASPEGILVSDKEQSSYIKPYVDSIHQQIMFAEKSWGSFRVLDIEDESMTIKVTLNPGHGMNYHSHENRDEVWTVISGTGRAILDGVEQQVKAGIS